MGKETYYKPPTNTANAANAVGRQRRSYAAMSRLQSFADEVIADGYKRGREMVVGNISSEIVDDLRDKGITLQTNEVVITDGVIMKYPDHPKAAKGATVDANKYYLVERTLRNPTHIYEHTEGKYLVYVNARAYSKGKVLKVIVQPNYEKKGRIYNLLKSIGVVSESSLNTQMKYRKIK